MRIREIRFTYGCSSLTTGLSFAAVASGDMEALALVVVGCWDLLQFILVWKIVPLSDVFAELRKAATRFVMSVCLSDCRFEWNTSAPAGRVFVKFI